MEPSSSVSGRVLQLNQDDMATPALVYIAKPANMDPWDMVQETGGPI